MFVFVHMLFISVHNTINSQTLSILIAGSYSYGTENAFLKDKLINME